MHKGTTERAPVLLCMCHTLKFTHGCQLNTQADILLLTESKNNKLTQQISRKNSSWPHNLGMHYFLCVLQRIL
jgi:hypothetical protein